MQIINIRKDNNMNMSLKIIIIKLHKKHRTHTLHNKYYYIQIIEQQNKTYKI